MLDNDISALQEEIAAVDILIKKMMEEKVRLSEKKSELNRRIKEMHELSINANKRLQGYSYNTLKQGVADSLIAFAKATKMLDPKASSNLCYDHFGYMLDMDMIIENVENDDALANAVIDTAGGKLIMVYANDKRDYDAFSKVRRSAKVENQCKHFMEKLTSSKVRKELVRYKVKQSEETK